VLAYVGIFLLSLFVALLAALQLADYFGATDELAAVLIAVATFATVAMAVLAIAARRARGTAAIDTTAALLALLAFAPLALHAATDAPAGPFAVLTQARSTLIQLIVPALLAVLVIWGLVRRHWLQRRGESGFSRWPWIATALTGFAILNPGGLELLGQALTYQPGNAMRDVARLATLGGLGLLAVVVLIEAWIRGRMQRRAQMTPG
jgi:hypothetical protein